MDRARLIAIGQTLTILVFGSLSGVLSKQALKSIHPFTFAWLQLLIGGTLLTVYTFVIRRERIPKGYGKRVWWHVVWIGILNFTIVRTMWMFALERLPATTVNYLVNFVGIVTMLMSIVILRERPVRVQVFGALIAIAGLGIFFEELPRTDQWGGLIFILIGVVGLALTNNIARNLAIITDNKISNNVVSTIALWVGGIPIILAGIIYDWPLPPEVTPSSNWWIVVFCSVTSIAIGLTVWNHILRTLRSYEAAVLANSTVIFTAIFALPILGEKLGWPQLAGIALTILGVSMTQIRREVTSKHSDFKQDSHADD